MRRSNWTTERRTKASIAYGDTQRQPVTPLSRDADVASLAPGEASFLTTPSDEAALPMDSEADESEREAPGAYAVSRMDDFSMRSRETWDPTERQPGILPLQQAGSRRHVGVRGFSDDRYTDEYISEAELEDEPDEELPLHAHCRHHQRKPAPSRFSCCHWAMIVLGTLVLAGAAAVIGAVIAAGKSGADGGSASVSDETSIPTDVCDFTGIDSPDPFQQCACHQEISKISDVVESTYRELRASRTFADHIASDVPIRSCASQNVAMIWVATEIVSDDEDALVEGEDSFVIHRLKNRFVLACVYAAWEGSKWISQNAWLTSRSECSWKGVSCNADGSVSSLVLPDNNLSGFIETRLGILQELRHLDLTGNKMQGAIPEQVWNLGQLEELKLGDNQVTGSISSSIGQSTALKTLRLGPNELSGSLPTEIETIAGLLELDAHKNNLDGSLPADIGALTALEVLALQENPITGSLPPSIALLANLKILYIRETYLSGSFPGYIGNMTSMEILDVGFNFMHGSLPTTVGHLTNLAKLSIEGIGLTGTIPSELGLCKSLEKVAFEINKLTGTLPAELANLSKLYSLTLGQNHGLGGQLPNSLGSLDNPILIQIEDTAITGTIPSSICDTAKVIYITGSELLRPPCACCAVSSCAAPDLVAEGTGLSECGGWDAFP